MGGIAVIGMACRLPGAPGSEAFWRLLRDGRHAVTVRGGRPGGHLDGAGLFDAGFFGMSPREAAAADPRQRLVLELAWEALEDAAIVPGSLRGGGAAVYVGTTGDDYAALVHGAGPDAVGHHTFTGLHRSVIANRVSHTLGLRGPSLTVDTGQSSSLVAVHLAMADLARGEAELALVGGVQLNLAETGALAAERFGALSPTGACRTFDARADGFVRGEGGAVLVLKPLQRALADGDRVHGVLLGSAVNNDGPADGLAEPSADAQRAVIVRACAAAGADPGQVEYVELHGTGTRAGDPVEAAGLEAAYGDRATPLPVGSVKTNIGHLEGAAGIAGLLKVLLAIEHGELPPSLNFTEPNPDISFARLRVCTSLERGPRLAGVSSFGVGGTNCHVLVGAAPEPAPEPRPPSPPVLASALIPWPVSGHGEAALRAQAARLRDRLAEDAPDPHGLARALACDRTAFAHRAVVMGTSLGDLAAGLDAVAAGLPHPAVVRGVAPPGPAAEPAAGPVFVFPGQGSQWPGMARRLLEASPVFARHVRDCADALRPYTGWDLVAALESADLGGTGRVQPALFAVMTGLARLWTAAGVRPAAVVGHSQGEIAAAYAAGALTLDDAARVVGLRSLILAELPHTGAMASIRLGEPELAPLLPEGVTVAAANGPRTTIVTGPAGTIAGLIAEFAGRGVRASAVAIDYASHSAQVEPVRERLLAALADLAPRPGSVPFYSTVTGRREDGSGLDAAYWYRNLRGRVAFTGAVEALLADGHRAFLEASPHPLLTHAVQEAADHLGVAGVSTLGSLRRDEDAADRMARSLAQAHAQGAAVAWDALIPAARRVPLPPYAFQREHYWLDSVPSAPAAPAPNPPAPPAPSVSTVSTVPAGTDALAVVRAAAAAVLGHASPDAVDPGRTFRDLGFDSVSGLELRELLEQSSGVPLPAAAIFEFPTPEALAARLRDGLAADAVRPESAGPAEPIAVIGMACRFPGGADTPEALWDLVGAGREAGGGFPADRGWDLDDLLARSTTGRGGFLTGAAEFDAAFFGISPREATAMDPQQRVLLELAWEAVERSGIDPRSLAGSRTGAFVGAMAQDYGPRQHEAPAGLDGYLLTGGSTSVASGRIAYVLGLEGPALTVDTACSSSLVALHLAARSLGQGECGLALAGGATIMASPGMFTEFSKQQGLAPDGRCKPFSAAADGTAWSEGAALLVLERLSDAVRNGHPVRAVIRGSAINQDGASNGLTAPNGAAQRRVIRQALANAGLTGPDVDAVEAHGTGTVLGDPIEAEAVLSVYGQDRAGPAWLGSLKSNIGHTQAAAGAGGVIKMIQALAAGTLPPTLHAAEPTPHVDWTAGDVRLLTEPRPWPAGHRPRRAAVSSFGISGTNAHLILEEPPAARDRDPDGPRQPDGPTAWLLSGRTEAALAAQADRLADSLAGRDEPPPGGVARALAGRTRFDHRAAIVASTAAEFRAGLAALAQGEPSPLLVRGVRRDPGKRVLVFPGQGSQWTGMAVELMAGSAVFREHLEACAEALRPHTGWDLRTVLDGPLEAIEEVQPALFAVMTGLARVWAAAGVRADAVIGHSQGEIAAAYTAGALTLGEAAQVVALRSRALRALAGSGGMAAIGLPADRVRALAKEEVEVAAVNGPDATIVSGPRDLLADLVAACTDAGHQARLVPVDYASHSSYVEPVRAEILSALDGLAPRAADIPFYSTVTAGPLDTTGLDAAYWYGNLRSTVRFADTVARLAADGHGTFVEASPHPVLTAAIQETLARDEPVVVPTLRRGQGGRDRLLASAAEAHVQGVAVDWPALIGEGGGEFDPPTYPFQRERYWLSAGTARRGHPFEVEETPLADGSLVLTGRIGLDSHPWLADHALAGTVVLPGAALVELALHAAHRAGAAEIAEIVLRAPLPLPSGDAVTVQTSVAAAGPGGERAFTVHGRPGADGPWTLHATGTLGQASGGAAPEISWPDGLGPEPDPYPALLARGYGYGPAFQGLRTLWDDGEHRWAEAEVPGDAGFRLHPALLDAVLQARLPGGDGLQVPYSFEGVRLHAAGAAALRARWSDGRLDAVDPAGAPVLTVRAVGFRPLDPASLIPGSHVPQWRPLESLEPAAAPRCTVLAGPDGLGGLGGLGPPVPDLASVPAGADAPDLVAVAVSPADRTAPHRLLALLQEWLAGGGPARLLVVTRQAVPALPGDPVPHPWASALWGLVRTAQTENPGRLVLLDADRPPADLAALAAALAAGEDQFALRDGDLLVPRLGAGAEQLAVPAAETWRLVSAGGALALAPWPEAAAPLAAGQVRVALRAVGLNFRDVAVSLGMVHDPGRQLCGEGAGVVVETGPGVPGLRPGDRVMGLFPDGAGPVSVTDHRLVCPVPEGWSFAEAATVPIVFLTAYYGLVDLGGAEPGQRLLVHTATGGVGLAALQLARLLGLDVRATASPAKWPVLREHGLGDRQIASSRTLEFADRFADGVDLVLNSLAREYTDAGLGLLRPGGRFLDMGKTDIRDPAEVAAAHPGVAYQAFDVLDPGPDRLQEMLAELHALFTAGRLRPLPLTAFDLRLAPEAFGHLRSARHTGKIVLTVPRRLDPAGTVLVTGGTGTLGGLIARRLAERHGVRRLLLASRSGPEAPGAAELVRDLRALGAEARAVSCDLADRDAVAALLGTVPAAHPLTGIVHASGVLADAVVQDLTADRLDAVLGPKADGAWHLHRLTEHLDPARFVLFSSVAGILGTPGQANYAAANAFLDGLAASRRAAGLAATSLGWGFWDQASGMTGHLADADEARLRRQGILPLPTERALALFDAALDEPRACTVPALLTAAGNPDPPVLLRGLASAAAPAQAPPARHQDGLAEALSGLDPAGQADRLRDLVTAHLAAVLGHPGTSGLPGASTFKELGVDSLIAVELRNHLAAATGLRLSPTLAFDHPTPEALARHLRELLVPAAAADPGLPADLSAADDEALFAALDRELGGTRP